MNENTMQVLIVVPKHYKYLVWRSILFIICTPNSKAGPLRARVAFFKISEPTRALGGGKLLYAEF